MHGYGQIGLLARHAPPRGARTDAPINVLVVHNFYQQPGGEDQVFRDEVAMLRAHGHRVREFTVHNADVDGLSKWSLARKTLWNSAIYRQIRETIRRDQPQIAHFHNTFPLVSPAAYQAARDEGVGVVQTLHNFRLMCPSATLYRQGRICEECIGRAFAWPAVIHRCYRDSALASGLTATMVAYHRQRGSWHTLVDAYIALTEFSRQKFIVGGLPATKIVVKPNFVLQDPGEGPGGGGYAAFVGRLVPEKGIETILKAWRQLDVPLRLKILGDGPLRNAVSGAAGADARIEWLGQRPLSDVQSILSKAEMLIFPSEWFEGFPRTLIESLAVGTPVVASRIGAIPELVRPGQTGRLFRPGSAADLASEIRELSANPHELRAMRALCRQAYADQFTAVQNYPVLMAAYRGAVRS